MTGPTLQAAIQIESDDWNPSVPDLTNVCEAAVAQAWEVGRSALPSDHQVFQGPERPFEVSVVFSSDSVVHALNRDFRGKDSPTNVLSFPGDFSSPSPDVEVLLGDVILAFATVEREASEMEKSATDHVSHLVIHGVLHLLGYDHQSEKDAAEMERLEVECMAGLGLQDPYAVGH